VRIDLHTHSHRSDGSDSPAQVVAAAAARGLDVIALTDHDTAEGWAEATAAADGSAVVVLSGMEISCQHAGTGVHLLAYQLDPGHGRLPAELERILDGRRSRLPAILARLRELGIAIDVHDVRRVAGDTAATGRPHVADALIELGVVATREEAFRRFLKAGRPAYVRRYAPDLTAMISMVAEAGGVSVLAHPWGRSSRRVLDATTIAELGAAGLAGLEADHQDHDASARTQLRGLAGELGLVATGSSDYHGSGKTGHELGCHTTAPQELARLLTRAAQAAERARVGGASPPPMPLLPL